MEVQGSKNTQTLPSLFLLTYCACNRKTASPLLWIGESWVNFRHQRWGQADLILMKNVLQTMCSLEFADSIPLWAKVTAPGKTVLSVNSFIEHFTASSNRDGISAAIQVEWRKLWTRGGLNTTNPKLLQSLATISLCQRSPPNTNILLRSIPGMRVQDPPKWRNHYKVVGPVYWI